jgi:hypothetical protein
VSADQTDAGQDGAADADPTVVDEAEIKAHLDEARQRVLDADPHDIVVNHAIGLYELAAIHLSSPTPDLAAAALAIDAFGCLVEGLRGRLGGSEPTLRDALSNIRVAFVQIKGTARPTDSAGAEESPAAEEPAPDA